MEVNFRVCHSEGTVYRIYNKRKTYTNINTKLSMFLKKGHSKFTMFSSDNDYAVFPNIQSWSSIISSRYHSTFNPQTLSQDFCYISWRMGLFYHIWNYTSIYNGNMNFWLFYTCMWHLFLWFMLRFTYMLRFNFNI